MVSSETPGVKIRSGPDEGAVLTISDAALRFGRFELFNDLSLAFGREGRADIVALIGTNGSGKSALANVISGYYPLASGKIKVGEKDVTSLPPLERALHGFRRSFQNVATIEGITLLSYVMLGWEPVWPHGLLDTVLRLPHARREERRIAEAAFEALATAGLDAYWDRTLEACPYGVRKLADVVRAIGSAPGKIAVLDEPTSGVSQSERGKVAEVIRSALAHGGWELVIVIDHDVAFVRELCATSMVLEAGKMLASGPTAEVLSLDRVVASFAGFRGKAGEVRAPCRDTCEDQSEAACEREP